MDIQEFSYQYPELYDEILSRIQSFIDQHNITGEVPLMEWDDMLDLILNDLPLEWYENPDSDRLEPAVTAQGPMRGRPGGSGRPGGPGGPGRPGGPPARNRPPMRRPPSRGRFFPFRRDGELRDILRLLFLQELLG